MKILAQRKIVNTIFSNEFQDHGASKDVDYFIWFIYIYVYIYNFQFWLTGQFNISLMGCAWGIMHFCILATSLARIGWTLLLNLSDWNYFVIDNSCWKDRTWMVNRTWLNCYLSVSATLCFNPVLQHCLHRFVSFHIPAMCSTLGMAMVLYLWMQWQHQVSFWLSSSPPPLLCTSTK